MKVSGILLLLAYTTTSVREAAAQAPTMHALDRPSWKAAEPFTSLSSVRELADGRILVTDPSEPQLWLVPSGGGIPVAVSRTGSGPGEYTRPTVLVGLPADSTLLLDRDARRFLIIDPAGRIVATLPAPSPLVNATPFLRGSDRAGRLYFQSAGFGQAPDRPVAIVRWTRSSGRTDTVAFVHVASPRPVERTIDGRTVIVQRLMPYTPADDWSIASSGEVVVVHHDPYCVERVVSGTGGGCGPAVRHAPVSVVEADKHWYEPEGPPFSLDYPRAKPPFVAQVTMIDQADRAWVRRYLPAATPHSEWDVFDGRGIRCAVVRSPGRRNLLGFGSTRIYLSRLDDDDLQWLEVFELPRSLCG